ncbi:unnamed protein product [Periconia digitata]|uniref:Uncharacterized protein n=1 Tax=Periconia digitata TaxID=1303443 RepID=A0A9W4UVG3_9PLEO|nr:unnamed protein product [Periconia digitata]
MLLGPNEPLTGDCAAHLFISPPCRSIHFTKASRTWKPLFVSSTSHLSSLLLLLYFLSTLNRHTRFTTNNQTPTISIKMHSSQLLLLVAGAVASVSAQEAKATLNQFTLLPLDPDQKTATIVGSGPAATTYSFGCPAVTGSAVASSLKSGASSIGSAIESAASSAGGAAGSIASSLASAGISGASSLASAAASNIEMTPIARPTNARRDNVRLMPIPHPTPVVRRQDTELPDLNIACMPYTVIQGSETYAVKAQVTQDAFSFYAEFNATWKGDLASATPAGTVFITGISMLDVSTATTAPSSSWFTSPATVAVVSASSSAPAPSGSNGANPSGAPANSNPAAAGPLPTGAAVYFGAAAGLVGAVLAL